MGFKHRPDSYTRVTGFQVQITGAAAEGATDGSWKAVRGGGVRFQEVHGSTVGSDKEMQHTLGQASWDDINLVGPVTKSRKDMMQWYLDTVSETKDHRRNVSVILLGRDKKELYRYNYLDCYLIAYSITPLDADKEDECEESVTIAVGYSDNYLK